MDNLPALISGDELTTYQTLAKTAFVSGLFSDTKSEAQALIKMLAGRELDIPPFQAMREINIINGKTAFSAAFIASRIREKGGDYQALKYADDGCVLRFTRAGKVLEPDIEFNMKHAEALGLASKDNYRKQARTMLFWRALTMGARMFFPDVFGGPAYTPDELKGGVIDVTPADEAPPMIGPNGKPIDAAAVAAEAKRQQQEQQKPEVLKGGTHKAVKAEDVNQELPPELQEPVELPEPLPNPWMHRIEGAKGVHLRSHGTFLFLLPEEFFEKFTQPALQNRLSPADRSNIQAALGAPMMKDAAMRAVEEEQLKNGAGAAPAEAA